MPFYHKTIPYLYVIKHITKPLYYAGIRYARGCDPEELLAEDGYHTSSTIVNRMISKHGMCFKVLYVEIFSDIDSLKRAEHDILKQHDAALSDNWLNLQVPSYRFTQCDPTYKGRFKNIASEQKRWKAWRKTRDRNLQKYWAVSRKDYTILLGTTKFLSERLDVTPAVIKNATRGIYQSVGTDWWIFHSSQDLNDHFKVIAEYERNLSVKRHLTSVKAAASRKKSSKLYDIYDGGKLIYEGVSQSEGARLLTCTRGVISMSYSLYRGKYEVLKNGKSYAEYKLEQAAYNKAKFEKQSEIGKKTAMANNKKQRDMAKKYNIYKEGVLVYGDLTSREVDRLLETCKGLSANRIKKNGVSIVGCFEVRLA